MHLRTLIKWGAIGLLVLTGVLAIFILTFEINDYKEQLAAWASRAIGASVTIDGPLKLDLSFHPRLVAEGIRIANSHWASRPHLLMAERVEIEISLLPLLRRRVDLPNVLFTNLDLLLEEGPNGSRNWIFENPSQSNHPQDRKPWPTSELPTVELLTIQNSSIGYQSRALASPFNIDITLATTSFISDKPIRLLANGGIGNEPYSLEITTATMQEIVAPTEAWPVRVSIHLADASLLTDGVVSYKEDRVDLGFEISGGSLNSLSPLLQEDLPPLGPYHLSGRLANSPSEWQVADLNLQINRTEISGKARASRIDPSTNFEIDLGAKTIYVDDFLTKVPQSSRLVHPEAGLGDIQIPVTFLKQLDARVGINIKEFRLNDQSVGSGSLVAKAKDGLLHMELNRFSGWLGKLQLALNIDARGKEPTIRFEGKGDSINYGRMLKALAITDTIQGTTDLEFLCTGKGKTFNDVLKNSTLNIVAGPSVLIYRDPGTGSKRPIDLRGLRGSVYPGKAIKFGLEGQFRQKPLELKMTGGPVGDFIDSEKPWPIMISGRAANTSVLAKGDLVRGPEGFKISLTAGIQGDRITSLNPELPPLGPYRVTAKISSRENKIVVSNVRARFADTQLNGGLLINTSEQRPAIRGTLTSERLRFEDVFKPTPGPLPVEIFQGFDLNLGVRANRALIGKLEMSDVTADLRLENGLLTVSPIRGSLVFSDGKSSNLQGAFDLKFSHPSSTLTVQVEARSWPYGQLLQELEFTDRIRGTGELHLILKGKGTTIGSLLKESSLQIQMQTKTLMVLVGDEAEERIDNVRLILESEKGKRLQLVGKGAIENIPVSIDLRSGAISTLFAKSGQWPLAGTADLGNLYFKVSGKLDLPLDGENFSGRALLKGNALKDLDLILPTSLPNFGPFEISATVADSKKGFLATELSGHLEESKFKGRLLLTLKSSRPRIRGVITSEQIVFPKVNGETSDGMKPNDGTDLREDSSLLEKMESGVGFILRDTEFKSVNEVEKGEGVELAQDGKQDEPPKMPMPKEKGRVVPEYEIPVGAFNFVDLDLGFSIKDVTVPPHEVGDLDFSIILENGELTVAPLQGTLWGGAVDGRLTINTEGEIPHIHFQTKIQGLDYGRMFETTGVTKDVKGTADKIEVDLVGQGNTLREFLSQANGQVNIVDGELEFRKKYIDLWAADLITGLLTSAWETKEVEQFNCAVTKFDVESGIARSDEMLFDTKRVTIAGVGTLDLGTEEMDVLLTPQPKDPTLLSLGRPVRVSGPVAKPNVSAEKRDLLKSAGWLTLGITVPVLLPIAVPQVTGTSLGSGENPCESALAGQPIKPVKSRERSFFERITGFWKESEELEVESEKVNR